MSASEQRDEEPRTERLPRSATSVPIQTVVALVVGLAGGGGGSLLGTSGMRESVARIEEQLGAITTEQRRIADAQAVSAGDLRAELRAEVAARVAEGRELQRQLRDVELRLERLAPAPR